MKRIIYTERAPRPVGPYSQAVCVDGWVFISGQIPIDPSTGNVVKGDFKTQVERTLENLKAIVEAAGGSMSDIIKVTVFLRDMTRFSEFNEVYSRYFNENPPARSTVEIRNLPKDVDIEIEAIARLRDCPSK